MTKKNFTLEKKTEVLSDNSCDKTTKEIDLRLSNNKDEPVKTLRISADKWNFIKLNAKRRNIKLGDYLYNLANQDSKRK